MASSDIDSVSYDVRSVNDLPSLPERLHRQMAFIIEADKLKSVLRQSYLSSESRRENSGEHSWHITLLALVVAEYSNSPIDLSRVLKMLLIHDLVEVDAGDTFVYDEAGNESKTDRETAAAERIFGLLPEEQEEELKALWEEFEARQSAEAKFAAAIDRIMPVLHNYLTGGKSWKEHGITREQALKKNSQIAEGSVELWEMVRRLIDSEFN
jgi:putative hydrolases of HD superfamily